MENTETIAVVALLVSAASFVVSLLTLFSTRANIWFDFKQPDGVISADKRIQLEVLVKNKSAREVSVIDITLSQEKIVRHFYGIDSRYNLLFNQDLPCIYLAPYQACKFTAYIDLDGIDLSRPIKAEVLSSRHCRATLFDFSNGNDIKRYKSGKNRECK